MTPKQAHHELQEYFFYHASAMTPSEYEAFLVMLLALPLVPESWQLAPAQVISDIQKD